MNRKQIVYRFKRKVIGGMWDSIKDRSGIPLAITSDKGVSAALHIFAHRYPSIAGMFRLGETLIAEPDPEATQRLIDFKNKLKEEEEDQIKSAWWQK